MAKTRAKTVPASAPISAADLIAQCERRAATRNLPSEAALRELEAVMAHNAKVGRNARVTRSQALELLRSHGWSGAGSAFDRLIRQQYGRGWES